MRHTMDPLTDVIEHFSRQSRRMAFCAGLGLLLILGSLGYGSYRLLRQNTKLRYALQDLSDKRLALEHALKDLTNEQLALEIERDNLEFALEAAGLANKALEETIQKLKAEKNTPALAKSIEKLENSAASLQTIAADHWGWYAVLESYKTEEKARSAASRAVSLEGLRGQIIGVYLAENGYYALTLGGEFTDRNEAQGKVEKAKPAFDGAYLRHGRNWTEVVQVPGKDAAE